MVRTRTQEQERGIRGRGKRERRGESEAAASDNSPQPLRSNTLPSPPFLSLTPPTPCAPVLSLDPVPRISCTKGPHKPTNEIIQRKEKGKNQQQNFHKIGKQTKSKAKNKMAEKNGFNRSSAQLKCEWKAVTVNCRRE